MNKVVLFTGSSSGVGREAAKLFQTKNWKVAETYCDVNTKGILAARRLLPEGYFIW